MTTLNLKIGTRVQHRNTQQWGRIVQAVPQRDGTFEYEVQREEPLLGIITSNGWWASYHIGRVDDGNRLTEDLQES